MSGSEFLKKLGFREKIFLCFMAVALVLISLFMAALYNVLETDLTSKTSSAMQSKAAEVQQVILQQFNAMERAGIYLAYNSSLRNTLYQLSAQPLTQAETYQQHTVLKQQLIDVLYYLPNLSKVALVNPADSLYAYSGFSDDAPAATRRLLANSDWYNGLIPPEQDGCFSAVQPSPWSKSSRLVVSYYGRVLNEYDVQYAICEIQLPLLTFERKVAELQFPHTQYAVLDAQGKVLFASQPSAPFPENATTLSSRVAGTGWQVVLTNDMQETAQTLRRYRRLILLLGFLLLAFLGAFFLLMLRYFTAPFKILLQKIGGITWQDIGVVSPGELHPTEEFSYLNDLYDKLIENIQTTAQHLCTMEMEQRRAQYIALQAKMSPHFLHNALATIAAADETCARGTVSEMCCLLSQMLRYSLADHAKLVCISQEVENARQYLQFISWSYSDKFTYRIVEEAETEAFSMPPLMLQPLVENCLKHGFSAKLPPYHIFLHTYRQAQTMCIAIEDNGAGFSPEALKEIQRSFEEWRKSETLSPCMQNTVSGKQALISIYVRLYMFTGGKGTIVTENISGGGARVVLCWPLTEANT